MKNQKKNNSYLLKASQATELNKDLQQFFHPLNRLSDKKYKTQSAFLISENLSGYLTLDGAECSA